MPRLPAAILTFFAALAAQQLYARLVVPLIEPQAFLHSGGDERLPPPKQIPRDNILPWFREGDWELDPLNKLLETPDGVLILRSYRNQPDGTVELNPCTMVFLPRDVGQPFAERAQRATLLQAPQGAVLRLDEPLDLKTGRMGRLLGGRLVGEVTIRSENREAGPQDDLYIKTNDVEMTGARMVTDAEVDFRFGGHHGHGRRLRIELAPSATPSRNGPSFSGVKTLELLEQVWMHVDLGGGLFDAQPSAAQPPAARQPSTNREPVEVSCRGRFRFDSEARSATFHEQVHVVRAGVVAPGRPLESDQLQADLLQLYFRPQAKAAGPASPAQGAAASAAPSTGMPKLEFDRLSAVGRPVIIRSPSRRMEGRGAQLDWSEATRTIRLVAAPPGALSTANTPPAVLLQGSSEIWSGELECQLGAQSDIVRARAIGPGRLRADRAGRGASAEPIEASWQRGLELAPDGDLKLLTLSGQASVSLSETGLLTAEEIFVWLFERPREPAARPQGPQADPTARAASAMEPHKLAARERVHLNASAIAGDVNQLQVWFDHRPLAAAAVPARATAPAGARPQPAPGTAQPGPAAAGQAAPVIQPAPPAAPGEAVAADRPSGRRFHVRGELLRARLVVDGKRAVPGEIWVEGNLHIRETDAAGKAQPLDLQGDTLHAIEDDPRGATVRLTGRPASVVGQGLTLDGSVVNLQRTANQMWVEGPGRLTLPAGRGPQLGGQAKPRPAGGEEPRLEVRWQGGMTFDGLAARFQESVVGQFDSRTLRTSELQVRLTDRLLFTGSAPTSQVDVAHVDCPGEFTLDGKTLSEGTVAATEHVEARALKLNQQTGAIAANGPGLIVQVRRGRDKRLSAAGSARAGAPAPKAAPKPAAEEPLTYLHVRFQGALTGNMHARETTFTEQIESLYGPVNGWDDVLSAEELRADDLWLRCEKLAVRRAPAGTVEHAELEASDNVRVRGREFEAWGGRMTYAEAKDLLILEGDARTDAQLWRQQKLAGAVDRLNAKKIYFWPSTNHVKFEGVGGADLGDLTKP